MSEEKKHSAVTGLMFPASMFFGLGFLVLASKIIKKKEKS